MTALSDIKPPLSNPSAAPVHRILGLARRCLAAFPECALSWSWIVEWSLAQLGLQRKWSGEARAIDDPLERALVVFESALPTLKASLANDPPAQRREIMRAAHAVLAAAQETHLRTERLATTLSPENG